MCNYYKSCSLILCNFSIFSDIILSCCVLDMQFLVCPFFINVVMVFGTVLYILSVAVNYPDAVLVCQQDCTVLSFLLDHLLPSCQDIGDKDTPALCRVLIASVAACNHSPDAQTVLTIEIKSALQRALALPESAEKHSRVQAIAVIIGTVIDSCPVSGQIQNQVLYLIPHLFVDVFIQKWMMISYGTVRFDARLY